VQNRNVSEPAPITGGLAARQQKGARLKRSSQAREPREVMAASFLKGVFVLACSLLLAGSAPAFADSYPTAKDLDVQI
jgi:hypothetical protein